MPNSYGHAKDFFDKNVKDGQRNNQRDLMQYKNPSNPKPKVNDLVVYSSTPYNRHGHVSIISQEREKEIEFIQQNPGPNGNSRIKYRLIDKDGKWRINTDWILGWLRK